MRLLTPDSEPQPDGPITEAGRRYDPFDPAYLVDPYSVLIRLREEEPVFFAPAIGYWIVSRYETVKAVLRDARASPRELPPIHSSLSVPRRVPSSRSRSSMRRRCS
jgi:cytochrome P450